MKTITQTYDLVVAGGGLSGVCAALAAARHGIRTVLIQDRPMLGGNASSEFRMHICGADRHGSRPNLRETGILEELLLSVKQQNPNPNFWALDTVLWEACQREANLTLLLNTHVTGAQVEGGRISAISAIQLASETTYEITADIFVDATGDGTLAAMAGADWVYGRESKHTYGEHWAPEQADCVTMGSSLMFTTRDMGHPVPFQAPDWAYRFSEEALADRDHSEITSGYWWIELGGDALNTIDDAQKLYDELLKTLYGVWDHIKNGGNHGADNFALDWISPIAGKRESRRVLGDYVLREQDLLSERVFDDAVAYGGWSMDCHVPGGIHASLQEPTQFLGDFGAYTIPYRCLYSRNIQNLMLAGRIISCSHMAFSSLRVMATCALTGQAAGTAAAIAVHQGISPRNVGERCIRQLQNALMRDDCWLPGFASLDPSDAAMEASVTASDFLEPSRPENVINGNFRDIGNTKNSWMCPARDGQWLKISLARPECLEELALRFDSNLSREITPTISDRIRSHQAPGVPPELLRDYSISLLLEGKTVQTIHVQNNAQRLNRHRLHGLRCDEILLLPHSTNGDNVYRVFAVNAYRS